MNNGLNNDGMTIVELLVTFSILMVIVVGMFDLVMDFKTDLDDKQIVKDFTEFSNLVVNDINYDLIRNKPFAIAYKNVSTNNWTCKQNSGSNVCPTLEGKASTCSGVYPCAIYAYDENGTTRYKTMAFNIDGSDKTIGGKKYKYGVLYNNVYEELPNYIYADFTRVQVINIDNNGFFIIDYPFSIMGDRDNKFGFKIVYPFG